MTEQEELELHDALDAFEARLTAYITLRLQHGVPKELIEMLRYNDERTAPSH
jgi:hypothetical protein